MDNWYRNSWNMVVKMLGSDIYDGLKNEEIEKRREAYGSNIIELKDKGTAKAVIRPFFQLWFVVALIDAIILYRKGQIPGMILLLIISLLGIALQITAYFRKYKEFLRIKNMNRHKVRVIRSGITMDVESSELVIGDLVFLHRGEVVPADIRIIDCEKLKVMEGAITGNSRVTEKYSTKIEEEVSSVSNIKNMLFKSSIISDGNCQGIVTAVGRGTFAATTLQAMEKANPEDVGIIEECKKLWNIHIAYVFLISLLVSLISYFAGKNQKDALAFWESLFFVGSFYCVALVGAMVIASVRLHMDTDEIHLLNSASILKVPKINVNITEKHGVISEKRMILKEIYTDKLSFNAHIKGEEWSSNVIRVFNTALFCNSYYDMMNNVNPDYNYMIDRALTLHIENVLKYSAEETRHQRRFVIPYDAERRMATYVYKVEGKYRSYTKGLLESVIKSCTFIMRNGLEVELLKEDIEHARNKAVEMESKGYTVIALAYRNFNYEPASGANIESNMVFVGLVALDNYILDDAKEYIQSLRRLRIKPVFFTDDTKLTAYTWGKRIGILNSINEILSGIEIDNMSAEDFVSSTGKVSIYSKLSPGNKSKVIRAYKEKGAYIAFTSSGMGDITPAVNSDFNIIYNEEYGRTLRSFSDAAIKSNYIKNILFLINRSKLYLSQINYSLEFMFFSLMTLFLLGIVYLNFNNEAFQYSKILWLSYFSMPLLQIIILLDNPKDYLSKENFEISKVKMVNQYILALGGAAVISLVQLIAQRYLKLDMDYFLLVNLFMFLAVNKFRIRCKKVLSMGNALFGIIILFNIVLIFVLNR